MPSSENDGKLFFYTKANWNVDDLELFAKSIGEIYDVFLTLWIKQQLINKYFSDVEKNLTYFERYFENYISLRTIETWRDLFNIWKKQNQVVPMSYIPDILRIYLFQDFLYGFPELIEIYENINSYKDNSNTLKVNKIIISSPGLISFDGLGDIIREIRELIKDISWRNRQEKTKGQLDIIREYIRLRKENPELDIPLPKVLKDEEYLVNIVNKSVISLKEFEDEQKLLPIAENLEKTE